MPDTPTDFIAGLYAETTAIVLAQWPEVKAVAGPGGRGTASGIWQAEHLDQVPYADIVPPYAVIHVEDMSATDLAGGTCDAYQVTVDVYYICQVSGPLSGIQRKLQGFRQRLNNTAAQWMDRVLCRQLSWDDALPPNQFFVSKEMAHRAGRLRFTCIVADSFFATDAE